MQQSKEIENINNKTLLMQLKKLTKDYVKMKRGIETVRLDYEDQLTTLKKELRKAERERDSYMTRLGCSKAHLNKSFTIAESGVRLAK